MKRILITGGAGFVGANLALHLNDAFEDTEILVLDNLYRQGSKLNLPRLEDAGIRFIRGDVREPSDLAKADGVDFLIECSAEPSVLAGKGDDTSYLVQTNLQGAINCAEFCRWNSAGLLFLSTSRVYPIAPLVSAAFDESATRFDFADKQQIAGLSRRGVTEAFPLDSARSLYGATKYAAEVMLTDYRDAFGIPVIINRCGVIAGPWQFGKVDQGIAAFWTKAHLLNLPVKYIGFGGTGKQVRDFLHVADLCDLIELQLRNYLDYNQGVYNVGGGHANSVSLQELTEICQQATGNMIEIGSDYETRYADIPAFIMDNTKISELSGWEPSRSVQDIINDTVEWYRTVPEALKAND